MIPLYGFLHGDTLGLLILARPDDTIEALAQLVQKSADVRVVPRDGMCVVYRGEVLPPQLTVAQAGLKPLQRIDVVPEAKDVA